MRDSFQTGRLLNVIAGLLGWMLMACGHTGAIEDRFRAEYSCNSVRVDKLGGSTYRARGCGRQATYTCATPSVCVRESAPQSQGSKLIQSQRVSQREPRQVVTRKYDEERDLHIVQAHFKIETGVEVVMVGAPAAEMGDVFVQLRARAYKLPHTCEKLDILVNAQPIAGNKRAVHEKSTRRLVEAHFQFEQFKPLAGRFPSFGVRHCTYEVTFTDKQVQELRKFLVIYSELAITRQKQESPEPPATQPISI